MDNKKNRLIQKYIRRGLLLFILLLFLFIALSSLYISESIKPMDSESEEVVEIEIPTGSTRKNIALILSENGLIKDKLIFEYYVKFKGENNFQAGTYLMSPAMSLSEITEYLNQGDTPIVDEAIGKLVIPEGIGIEEISEKIEKDTDFSGEDFLDLIQSQEFIEKVLDKYPDLLASALEVEAETRYVLEGYLFPATYEIHYTTELEDLVLQMIRKTNSMVDPLFEEINNSELNVHEIMTLASYIEKEGVSLEDRKLISGVFYNRLEIDMPLQTDPSVLYALGEYNERVSLEDLEVDSPYNTYKYKGVGAGPINSPSEKAIEAAIYPTATDDLYFLADLTTGKIYFAETYEEHLKYKEKYLDNK